MSEAGPSSGDAGSGGRKIRLHKSRPPSAPLSMSDNQERDDMMDQSIAGLIPGISELTVGLWTGDMQKRAREAASSLRRNIQTREDSRKAELLEMQDIYDMSKPHPLDSALPPQDWQQKMRPTPRKIVLSHYQYEMINYQRMLMRKNIWYYRDRMDVPRGPCPLHVLKEAWVQGVVDENTLMWGSGLYDWLPAKNIKLLMPMIRTPEVRFGSWFKRTFSLKPALNNIRQQRAEFRDPAAMTKQVEAMR